MRKTINSVTKFKNENFKVKVGTTNKKKPDVVYIEVETYIKPLEDKLSFHEYMLDFDKKTKKFINKLIDVKKTCDKNFILITDIASERITKNKKSYLDLQVLLKPKEKNTPFKVIAQDIFDNYATCIIQHVENELLINNIECCKTKK